MTNGNKPSSYQSPMDALKSYVPADVQRTLSWGIDNQTNDSIEISFGRLTSRYTLKGYTDDTGTHVILANGSKGQGAIRDPAIDTNGVPIAATDYDYTVKIVETNQDLQVTDTAPAGQYMVQASCVITYAEGRRGKEYKVLLINRYQKYIDSQ